MIIQTNMRAAYQMSFVLFVILPGIVTSQQNGIDAALQKGMAADLGIHFHKSIDLSLPGLDDTFTADQAVSRLSDFFAAQTVKGYKKVHTSTPQEGRANYSIGDLYTARGTYRITLFFDKEQKITEIRIQK